MIQHISLKGRRPDRALFSPWSCGHAHITEFLVQFTFDLILKHSDVGHGQTVPVIDKAKNFLVKFGEKLPLILERTTVSTITFGVAQPCTYPHYDILNPGLETKNLELNGDQFVATHYGFVVLPPFSL